MKLKLTLAAAALTVGLGISAASAMPVGDLTGAANTTAANGSAQVDQVRLVCNRWGRCWHVGGYRWHRGWHGGRRWHHWRRW